MNAKESNVSNLGNDQYGLKIVNMLLELRETIYAAADAYEKNDELIGELHLLRTDMEHQMAYVQDDDPVRDALIQQKLATKYRQVQQRRRDLLSQNLALEHIVCNEAFVDEIGSILEKMTGQLQFVEHAQYKPKSRLSYIMGGVIGYVHHR